MSRAYEDSPFSLTYQYTEEVRIESGLSADIPAQAEEAFCFALKEGVRVTLADGENERSGKVLGGELFHVPAGCRCYMQSVAKYETHLIIIRYSKEAIKDKKLAAGDGENVKEPARRLTVFRMPQIRNWIQDFLNDASELDTVTFYQLQAYLYAMTAAMLSAVHHPKEPEEDLLAYVEQTRRYMVEQFQQPMDIEKLALQSGTSSSKFYQAFRRYTGLSPHKFITKVRLDASLSMLASSMMPIIEVAHSLGYTDEYYFSRLFKKHLGMAPTEFAGLAQKKIVTLCRVFNGDLEALGITPMMSLKAAWTEQAEEGLAAIRAAEPELIITGPADEHIIAALSDIAPTVILAWKSYSWKERFVEIAELLGLSSVAERWLAYYDLKVDNARHHVRRHLGDEPLLLVMAWPEPERYRVFGTKWRKLRDVFYEDLHISSPDSVQEITVLVTEQLDEAAELACPNVLFFIEDSEPDSFCRQLEERWRILNRARERHYCLFVRYRDHLQYNASMHESLVEQTVRQLLANSNC
ncbi:helix-turn-helix domain-containing protein [Paenibacillus sp. GCM10027626]|uniref:helix-turn-helix domain-containing protein n=1 Tax=Paenibacillus sp. GCM10027626 TaxID=3273411 RepID=UPI0036328B3F